MMYMKHVTETSLRLRRRGNTIGCVWKNNSLHHVFHMVLCYLLFDYAVLMKVAVSSDQERYL